MSTKTRRKPMTCVAEVAKLETIRFSSILICSGVTMEVQCTPGICGYPCIQAPLERGYPSNQDIAVFPVVVPCYSFSIPCRTLGLGMMLWPCTMVCEQPPSLACIYGLYGMQPQKHTELRSPGPTDVIPHLEGCLKCQGLPDMLFTSTSGCLPPPGRGGWAWLVAWDVA